MKRRGYWFALALLCSVSGTVLAQSPRSSTGRYIPYIVQGQGWNTGLTIINTCEEPKPYLVGFYNSEGEFQELEAAHWDKRYNGIGTAEDDPVGKESIFWWFSDPGERELLQAYGMFLNDGDGCITGTAEYFIKGKERTLIAVSAFQDMADGWMTSFVNLDHSNVGPPGTFEDCQTSYAISGVGEEVTLQAYQFSGELIGEASLGPVYHTSFPISRYFPEEGIGILKITGKSVVTGLEFCNGQLVEASLHSFPLSAPRPPLNQEPTVTLK